MYDGQSRMVNDDTIGPEDFWVTLRTVSARWEAELIAELLAAHDIPVRIVDLGFHTYLGQGSPAKLLVCNSDRWTAMLLTSNPEAEDVQ